MAIIVYSKPACVYCEKAKALLTRLGLEYTVKVESKDLSLEEGQKASQLCVINILAQLKKALNGDLDKTKNCVKITGYVNSTNDFIDQPKVINPASEILSKTFGEKGKHSRAAVSVNSLPLVAAVEIDSIFEI